MPKVFLDKIVTSAHLPPQRGSTGYTSTTTLPDLSHTLVHTEYAPAIIQAMTPKGEMTRKFRAYGHKLAREVERPRSEMKRKVKFFKRAHNVFANKILLDMQKNVATKNERRERIWRDGKIEYGFDHLEGGDPEENTMAPQTSDTLKDFVTIGATSGSSKHEGDGFLFDANFTNEIEVPSLVITDEYGDDEFEAPENSNNLNSNDDGMGVGGMVPSSTSCFERPATSSQNDRPTTSALKAGRSGSKPPTASVRFDSTATEGSVDSAGPRPGTSAASTRNGTSMTENLGADPGAMLVLDIGIPPPGSKANSSRMHTGSSTLTELSQFTDSECTATSGKRRRKKKKGFASDNRKRIPYNRATMFECIYDTLEVPPPHAPRFGMMSSPDRPASSAGIIKSRFPAGYGHSQSGLSMTTVTNTLNNSASMTTLTASNSANTHTHIAPLSQASAIDSIVSRISSASSRRSRGPGQPGGLDRWAHEGVRRAMYGEPYGPPRDYR